MTEQSSLRDMAEQSVENHHIHNHGKRGFSDDPVPARTEGQRTEEGQKPAKAEAAAEQEEKEPQVRDLIRRDASGRLAKDAFANVASLFFKGEEISEEELQKIGIGSSEIQIEQTLTEIHRVGAGSPGKIHNTDRKAEEEEEEEEEEDSPLPSREVRIFPTFDLQPKRQKTGEATESGDKIAEDN